MTIPKQVFTLRGHLSEATCNITFNDPNQQRTTIVSADSNGWIIWWDLIRKRPIGTWKGHDSSILTMRQLENNLLLTHAKDSEIRIWDILDFKRFNSSTPLAKFNDTKYFNVEESQTMALLKDELKTTFPLPPFASIPVNSLNFCNVECLDNNYLITPGTQASENFDIYSIFKSNEAETLDEKLNLTRIIANFDPYKLYKKTLKKEQNIDDEINSPMENAKRDKFGIMMRILAVEDNIFFIGYESGHVLGFSIDFNSSCVVIDKSYRTRTNGSNLSSLMQKSPITTDRTIISKDPKITLIYYNSQHVPNPIISICNHEGYIISGSTDKKILVHDYINSEVEDFQLKNSGMQSIISLSHDLVIIGFWNGVVRGFNFKSFHPEFKIAKKIPVVESLESSIGNSDENNYKLDKLKLSCINCVMPSNSVSKKSYKDVIKSKKLTKKRILIIGYNDGTLIAYEL